LNGGGAYWLFSLVVSQVSVFVCVHIYLERAGDAANKIDADTLWAGAGLLAAGWLVTFTYFVFRVAVPKCVESECEERTYTSR
jgi:hypothetical protein